MAGAPLSPSELAEVRVMLQEWRQHRAMDTLSISSSGPSEEATGSIEPRSGSIFSSPAQPASDGSSIAVNMANAPLGIRTAAAWGALLVNSGAFTGRTYDYIRLYEGRNCENLQAMDLHTIASQAGMAEYFDCWIFNQPCAAFIYT